MKVVITGAAGFIGSHVAAALSGKADVVGIDDLSTGSLDNLDGIDCDLTVASILDRDALAHVSEGVDAVVHLAARASVPRSVADPEPSHDANATGTLRVLEAARAANPSAHVIVASSSSVYGANPELPKREAMTPMPMSPYAVSKLATEQYALAWQYSYGMPTLAFRFFNVFGPRQSPGHVYAAVVPAFVYAALRGDPVTVFGDGQQSRDFTYVGTVAGVIVDAIERTVASPTPVNLAFGSRTNLLELLELIRHEIDVPLDVVHQDARVGDVRHSQADNSTLVELFPDVVPVTLDEGLRRTIEWMRTIV